MVDGRLIDQDVNAAICLIEKGKVFREGASFTYNFEGNVIDACVDSCRYVSPQGLRAAINEELLSLLDSIDDKSCSIKLAENDKSNVVVAYLISHQEYDLDEVVNLITSKDPYLELIGIGLAIIYKFPQIIPVSNIEGLYKYFRSCEVSKDQLVYFVSDDFLKYSFEKMQKEEKVIFTWMVKNLYSLIEVGAVDVGESFGFFVEFFKGNDYLNETHKALYRLVLKKKPSLVEQLLGVRLCIDPFTKQCNYSKWLKEVGKFKFISDLRDSLSGDYSSDGLIKFDRMKADLYRINRNDRSFVE